MGALLKIGVPYGDAMIMPVPIALALLRGLGIGRQQNTHENSKRRVAARRTKKS